MLKHKEIQTIIAIITESKVIEIFCMADDFCKFFWRNNGNNRTIYTLNHGSSRLQMTLWSQIAPCPENIPPKGMCFSDLICIFAMSIVGFSCFLFATLRQINSSTWQNPGPLGQSKNFLLLRRLNSLIYNSVAELRTYTLSWDIS